ncbi:hypothetical protein GCM10027074_74160 [Streptomyces deserti]
MDVRLRLPDDPDGGELKQLYDWLLRDHDLRHDTDISLCECDTEAETDGTSMGDALGIVQLVVDSALQLALLGVAIVEWRRAQRPRSSVVVEHDGIRVTLPPEATPEQVQRIIDTLRDTDPPPEDPEDSPPGANDPPGPEGDAR